MYSRCTIALFQTGMTRTTDVCGNPRATLGLNQERRANAATSVSEMTLNESAMISHATKTLQTGAVLKEQTSLVFNKKKAEAASWFIIHQNVIER